MTIFRSSYKVFESTKNSELNVLLILIWLRTFSPALEESKKNSNKLIRIVIAVKTLVTKFNERFGSCEVVICDETTTQEVFLIRIYLNKLCKRIWRDLRLAESAIRLFENTEKFISDNLNPFSYIDSYTLNNICPDGLSAILSANFTQNHEIWKIYGILLSMSTFFPRRTECVNSVNDLPIPLQINLVSLRSPDELRSNISSRSCSIYYDDFSENENVGITDSCRHIFCVKCTEN